MAFLKKNISWMHIMNVCVKKVKMKKFLVCRRKYVGFVILYVGLCVLFCQVYI